MSTLAFQDYEILSGEVLDENVMPDIGNIRYIHADYRPGAELNEEDARFVGKGGIRTLLPYTQQDNYTRDRKPRQFHAAILENDKLKAVFLPELGGRLWSLYHKGLQRELLYVNPVFQPANLALRNAWFSGGVEFNLGIRGHSPFTCSPLHAVRMEGKDGQPYLRMYEYERIRGAAYHMDFTLPEGSETLYLRVTIENTAPDDTYMYWWSNIAVPETPHSRVIAPCTEALQGRRADGYTEIGLVPIPHPFGDDFDCSYPARGTKSVDYFFRIPNEHRKWETCAEADGKGLLHFSTHELKGRKLFLWGNGRGGRNWNRWLCSKDNYPYIEIQAGLARSQYEHILMKSHSTFTWVEGYTALNCKPESVHGDFSDAIHAVDAYLDGIMPTEEKMFALFDGIAFKETAQHGSGWGCVENLLRAKCGKAPISAECDFPVESMGESEKEFYDFVLTGELAEKSLGTAPKAHFVSADTLPLYEKQIADGKAHAYLYLHYGTALYANGRADEAYAAYEKSNALQENAWAYRNLSMIEANVYGNTNKALTLMDKALALNCKDRGLVRGAAQLMLSAGAEKRWLELYAQLDAALRGNSRLQLYTAIALIRTQQYEEAAKIINENFVLNDIEEGEVSLSAVWLDLYRNLITDVPENADEDTIAQLVEEQFPLPAHLDFRMS